MTMTMHYSSVERASIVLRRPKMASLLFNQLKKLKHGDWYIAYYPTKEMRGSRNKSGCELLRFFF